MPRLHVRAGSVLPASYRPREVELTDAIETAIREAPVPPEGGEVLAILATDRSAEGLRQITELMPPPGGMDYSPEAMRNRAAARMTRAMAAGRAHGGDVDVIVDLGCGRGDNALCLGDTPKTYIGVDIDDRLFGTFARDSERHTVTLLQASASDMPLESASVDLVVAFNTLEHFDRPGEVLAEAARVLRPGGVFYTEFGPPFNAPFGPHHNRQTGLPYVQHLFTREVVSEFIGRPAYSTLNCLPLRSYRELLWDPPELECVDYKEHLGERGLWLPRSLPEAFAHLERVELVTNMVTATLRKRAAAGRLSVSAGIRRLREAIGD